MSAKDAHPVMVLEGESVAEFPVRFSRNGDQEILVLVGGDPVLGIRRDGTLRRYRITDVHRQLGLKTERGGYLTTSN